MTRRIDSEEKKAVLEDRGVRASGWKVTVGRLLEAERKDEEEHWDQLSRFLEKTD